MLFCLNIESIFITIFVRLGGFFLESKIEVLSTVKIQHSPDFYKVVDALNRTLKERDLMFGLALDPEDQEQAVFTIYRT
jgi:hypothetical protein